MRYDETLPKNTLAKKPPRETSQFVLYAAAPGQIAQFNKAQRQTAFSTSMLGWLEGQPATLPPDTQALWQHIENDFHRLRIKPNLLRPGRQEVPVTCWFVVRGGVCSVDGGSVGVR